jgi:hypothetical protein
MKNIIGALALITMTGCASLGGFKNTDVLVQKNYVVRTAPDTLKTLPPLPPALENPKTATNTQVAGFINDTEEYVANLEAMIQTLVNYYEKPVTAAEAGAMKPVTPLATPTPNAARVIQPQTSSDPTKPSRSIFPWLRAK